MAELRAYPSRLKTCQAETWVQSSSNRSVSRICRMPATKEVNGRYYCDSHGPKAVVDVVTSVKPKRRKPEKGKP